MVRIRRTIRLWLTALLALSIALWAEAGLAFVQGDQVMQCSMTIQQMQAMGAMTCCPDEDARVPALSEERPPCCSVSSDTERPLGFLVSSQQVKAAVPDATAEVVDTVPSLAAQDFAVWRNADAPRFVKPVP